MSSKEKFNLWLKNKFDQDSCFVEILYNYHDYLFLISKKIGNNVVYLVYQYISDHSNYRQAIKTRSLNKALIQFERRQDNSCILNIHQKINSLDGRTSKEVRELVKDLSNVVTNSNPLSKKEERRAAICYSMLNLISEMSINEINNCSDVLITHLENLLE